MVCSLFMLNANVLRTESYHHVESLIKYWKVAVVREEVRGCYGRAGFSVSRINIDLLDLYSSPEILM